jgi:two-component system phosphate regulon sensor histidine kinase PhoR
MRRTRFLWKLFAGYALLILLTSATIGILIGRRIEGDSLRELEGDLREKAVLLRELVRPRPAESPDPEFQRRIRALGEQLETRFTVIRSDGRVLADSWGDPAVMEDHSTRPEVLEARDRGEGTASRFSETVGVTMMYLALPVRREGERVGTVRAAIPLTAVEDRIVYLRGVVALATLTAVAAALALGYFLARRITRPLRGVTEAALSIAAGDYGRRVQVGTRDEFGQLARSFNSMSEQLAERIEAERRERDQLEVVLGGMVEGVVAVDAGERVVHMNRAAERFLGVPPGGGVGRRFWEIIRFSPVREAIRVALEEGEERSAEVTVTSEATDRSVELEAAPLRGGGAVVVLHDVTNLRILEAIRRDFVANVSHELKTPVSAIRGIIETVLEDGEMSPEVKQKFLVRVRDQSLRLSAILTDLLTLSRLEAGEGRPPKEPVDLAALARRCIEAQRAEAEEKGLELVLSRPRHRVTVTGGRDELAQAVDNLITNAVKYTPSGGRIEVRLAEAGDEAVIEVEDTGIGIEPAHRDRIFERFYRVDKARSRELGGTGLGLSIVKHIVRTHGGTVTVESASGAGSTFRIRLPLRESGPDS